MTVLEMFQGLAIALGIILFMWCLIMIGTGGKKK